ncbi:XRE family transcriptional regulator [Nocardiopsis alba]|uniref:XRE family transcriptional regulator n=1 Tax=Nocardiopsis alba TaxID=53437 RepID=UPI0036701851
MNAALRKALAEAQLTETDVAAHLGVDPKTVRRWLSGQRPYPRHRWALADLLQTEEHNLWPDLNRPTGDRNPLPEHAYRVYAHRWQIPREVWWDLFSSAEQEIGILVYSGLFLADDAGILNLLRARAQDGVNVRILIGNPESQQVKQRGKDEEIGETLAARAQNALILFRTLMEIDTIEVRTHSTVLYNSIYMTEKRILANHHIYGLPAAKSPVIEIDPNVSLDMSKAYTKSFEQVWESSRFQTKNHKENKV